MGQVFGCCTMEQHSVSQLTQDEVVIDIKGHNAQDHRERQEIPTSIVIKRELTPIRDFESDDEEDGKEMPPMTAQKGSDEIETSYML